MTTEDLRDKVLDGIEERVEKNSLVYSYTEQEVKLAMDEFADIRMGQLLEWMAKKEIECNYDNGRAEFHVPNEGWISAKELIKNFL